MTAAAPALLCEGVSYTYGARQALDGVSFQVEPGEIFGVLGPNGSGKTTLFRLLSTLVPHRSGSGSIALNGHAYPADAAAARRSLGVVFQSPSLDKKLTVAENLLTHGALYGLHGRELETRVALLLERFALTERRRDRVETLSGGLQRRVEIAKSLIPRPSLLILDEPSTGLDPSARRELWDYLRALRESEKLTLLMTTHFLDEAEWCDRLLVLDEGKVVALDTPDALKRKVGGALLSLQPAFGALAGLREGLRTLGLTATERGVLLDVEAPADPEAERRLVDTLLTRFRPELAGLTISTPSLETVFTRLTGKTFTTSDAEGGRSLPLDSRPRYSK
jgi:ABC-2 type transport system ATP-binding protein